jgi:hypothetical protein
MAKSKVSLTPQQITDQWSNRMKASVTRIQTGIDNVTESPMQKAAQQQTKMLTNLTTAITSGRWANGLNSVTLADWKNVTKSKVASSLAAGVDNAKNKHLKFANYLVNTVNGGLNAISQMPRMTIDDNIARATAMMRYMHDNSYKAQS